MQPPIDLGLMKANTHRDPREMVAMSDAKWQRKKEKTEAEASAGGERSGFREILKRWFTGRPLRTPY